MSDVSEVIDQFLAARERMRDGRRLLVPVIGAGLHKQLAQERPQAHRTSGSERARDDSRALLADWNTLLRSVAGNCIDPVCHIDPTATWEGVISAAARADQGPDGRPSSVERSKLRCLRCKIIAATPGPDEAPDFFARLQQAAFLDIASLNFDQTLAWALHLGAGADGTSAGKGNAGDLFDIGKGQLARRRAFLHQKIEGARVWYPHGIAHSRIDPRCMQHSQRAYVQAAGATLTAVDQFRVKVAEWRRLNGVPEGQWAADQVEAWSVHVRSGGLGGNLSWIDLLMVADLVFVGCSLDRAELDLWMILHERQRQFARVDKEDRPKAFAIFKDAPCHLETEPAGLNVINVNHHRQVWSLALEGRL